MAASSSSSGTTALIKPHSHGRDGVDRIAGEGHLQRPLASEVARHGDERGVAEQAALATGEGERCALRGHGEVAGGHELAAGRGGQRVHAGDDHLGDVLDGVHHRRAHRRTPRAPPRASPRPCRRSCGRRRTPGRWPRGSPRWHRPSASRERLGQLAHHVERQGVALVGPVDRDRHHLADRGRTPGCRSSSAHVREISGLMPDGAGNRRRRFIHSRGREPSCATGSTSSSPPCSLSPASSASPQSQVLAGNVLVVAAGLAYAAGIAVRVSHQRTTRSRCRATTTAPACNGLFVGACQDRAGAVRSSLA